MKNLISIVTLTYNKLEEGTKPFLNSLYKNTFNDMKYELIIVDNGSTDGTVEFLKTFEKENKNVKVIYNSDNKGFACGCNQGIRIASGDYIALLNNDILLSKNWIAPLLQVFKKEVNAGLVSSNAVQKFECRETAFLEYIKCLKAKQKSDYKKVIKPDFSCVLCKKSDIIKVGLFDEKFYPAYFEDDDLCWRFIFAGYTNYISNESYIYHKGSLTGNSLNNLNDIFEKNKQYFFQKYQDRYYIKYLWERETEITGARIIAIKKKQKRLLKRIKFLIKGYY